METVFITESKPTQPRWLGNPQSCNDWSYAGAPAILRLLANHQPLDTVEISRRYQNVLALKSAFL
jgi:hypothetical protein